MESGVCVSKQIHLDEQLVAYIYFSVRPFPHGVCTRTFLELRVCRFAYTW
ncbi:hypothetical protein Krac_11118 [Ktedonobacter racemifer DSM 44963]|uniref:Uncharacterized protein n=1 Tax=Ktedonobacter racemifer DSM 44963 TaxID=485913 RepID=D6TJE7_KTERA|nr:hypothetical protein Krac_11118 [Ktedonobacter racemifer DSM 44963]